MKSDRIYGWSMLVVLCLLILFRLIVWKFFTTVEPFVKEDLTNLLCAVPILVTAGIFYGRKAAMSQPFQDRRTGIELAVWFYFAACAFSLVPSVDRVATLRYVVVLFSYVLLFFMLAETLDDPARRTWFLVYIFALALLIAGWGIRDYIYLMGRAPDPSDKSLVNTNDSLYYILMNKRACSFFGWPNVLAGFLGLTIPLVSAVALAARHVLIRLAAGVSVFVLLAALVMTFSFLGWLSFLIGFIVIMAVLLFKRAGMGRGIKLALILFAVISSVLFTIVIVKKDFSISVSPRRQYFNQSIKGIERHPILGTGLDTFRYASTREAVDVGGLTAFAHNSYLQLWVEAGLPGFLAGLVLAFFVLRKLYGLMRRREANMPELLQAAAFAWAFTAFFVDNMWSFTLVKPNISLFFWVVLAYVCSVDMVDDSRRNIPLVRAMVSWAVVVVTIVVLFFTVRGLTAQWLCKNAMALEGQGKMQEAMRAFIQARQIDPNDSRIAFEIGKRYVQGYKAGGDQRLLALGEQEFLAGVDNSPFYGSRLMLGLIYRSQGRAREAKEWIEDSYSVAPMETDRDLRGLGIVR